jgi:cell division septation protein DedD
VAEFDPRQLDQLEDALEHLADHRDLESLELPAAVTERLSEYEDVLALCRDAFPLESPPDELLTGVIAEAREVSRRPRSRNNQRRAWRRAWERWRGTVVPGFALAATAAVVLWVLDPDAQLQHATELSNTSDRADGSANAELERSEPASEATNEIAMPDALEPPKQQTVAPPEPQPKPDEQRTNPKSGGGSKPAKSKAEPEPTPEPAPAAMNKDETWTTLERADAARRTGNCDRARSLYDEVIAASSDSQAIAQAKGGIGLCFEQDRRDSDATKWFNDARAASPSIDAWINDQREEQPLPGEIKKARSKKDFPADADAL